MKTVFLSPLVRNNPDHLIFDKTVIAYYRQQIRHLSWYVPTDLYFGMMLVLDYFLFYFIGDCRLCLGPNSRTIVYST